MRKSIFVWTAMGLLGSLSTQPMGAQPQQGGIPGEPGGPQGFPGGPGGFPGGPGGFPGGPGGFPRGPGGPGGFGPPGMGQERKILKTYDKDNNKILDLAERKVAREAMAKEGTQGGPGFGGRRGGPPGMGPKTPGTPGAKVSVGDAKVYSGTDLYDTTTLRTIFLEFESPDWEKELEVFHGTDVDVPAKLTMDGKTLKGRVGVHFRGMSSYGMVPTGSKRSFNIAVDLEDPKQRLLGVKTINLLNGHEDPSMMSTVLYSQIARKYLPAPRANFARVVVDGESWGLYVNVEQFNKDFTEANFKVTKEEKKKNQSKAARWKVRGSPGGGGGLEYIGDNVDDYKRRYEMKSGEDAKAWKEFVNLCKVLNQTPADKLEEAIKPILDVDGLLWFLALDVALINTDGYWIRSSDYSIYKDAKGVFHIVPHDMNEAFRQPMGPGMGGPPGMMGFNPPKPGEVMDENTQRALNLNESQKAEIARIQKTVDERLNKIFNANQKQMVDGMRQMRPFGPGGPGGPGGFPGGPGGLGGSGSPRGPGGPGGFPGGFPGGPGGPGGQGGFGRGPGGPGGPGGMMGISVKGVELDPLVGLEDSRKPLRSKILAVPTFREKYLRNINEIAKNSISWDKLGPQVATLRELIKNEVKDDTRKLESYDEFLEATSAELHAATAATPGNNPGGQMRRGPVPPIPLREFAEKRSRFLMENKEVKKASDKK